MGRPIDADLLMRKCEKWLKPKAPDEDEMVSLADIAVSMLMEIENSRQRLMWRILLSSLRKKEILLTKIMRIMLKNMIWM